MLFDAIVEIPRGSRNKYELDRTGRIRLDRMLFISTEYPYNYGLVPGTLAEDGDPLDVLILGEEPIFPGITVHARTVAVFWMHDEHGPDAKILAAPSGDSRYEAIGDLADVPRHQLNEIAHFFDVYKDLEPGKDTDTRGWQDRAHAEEVLADAYRRHDDELDHSLLGRTVHQSW